MRVLIKITKDVLERSKNCKSACETTSTTCGIAIAVIDLFPLAKVNRYQCNLLGMTNEKGKYMPLGSLPDSTLLPKSAIHFIELFDSCLPSERVLMPPFSFEIEVPEYVIEKIGLGQIYKVLSESKTLEHVN